MSRRIVAIGIALLFCSNLFAQDRSVVRSYMTDTAPEIDGEISGDEWDAAGPWINVTATSPNAQTILDIIDDDEFSGDADASFRFKTMWVEETTNFYLLYEVFDDIANTEAPTNPWETDQIETFIDGTHLEGQEEGSTFHWFAESGETYGKFGVSRLNVLEGNHDKMTDDVDEWDEGFSEDFIALSAAKELDTNADYRIELGISLEAMLADTTNEPFAGTPTDDEGHIVMDSTQIKFTVGISDDDDFAGDGERSHEINYFREIDGEAAEWDVTSAFADLLFTGEYEEMESVLGDCDGDNAITNADLSCSTNDALGATLDGLGILRGDFNGDKQVNFTDFLVLSTNFGQPGKSYAEGNADGVGNVDFNDFLALSTNFGQSAGASASAAAVPEPSAGILLLFGFLAAAGLRSNRR